MGTDQRQQFAGPFCLHSFAGSQRAIATDTGPRQCGQNNGCAGDPIIAYDLLFFEKLPKLFPHAPAMRDLFAGNPQLVEATAKRNSSLQGAYLIIAARSLGLDCGPMSGFDNAKLDEEFFGAGEECEGCEQEFFPSGHVKSNFLCNLGYGDATKLFPRGPRLEFSEACSLL